MIDRRPLFIRLFKFLNDKQSLINDINDPHNSDEIIADRWNELQVVQDEINQLNEEMQSTKPTS